MTDFSQWLQNELQQRGWTQTELARRGDISQQTISAIITRRNPPGTEACRGIAQGLNLPLHMVLQQAGIPVPKPDRPLINQIIQYLALLSDDDLKHLLWLLKAITGK